MNNLKSVEEIQSKTPKPVIVIICVGVLLFVIIGVINSIAKFYNLELTSLGQLGDAVNGLSAPFLGFCSVVLVYITFREQNRSNLIQQAALRKQDDLIAKQENSNSVLSQRWELEKLERMFSEILDKYDQIKYPSSHTGTMAVETFAKNLQGHHLNDKRNPTFTDLVFILLNLNSYIWKVSHAITDAQTKYDLYSRAQSLYTSKLEIPLELILQTMERNQTSFVYETSVVKETTELVNSMRGLMTNLQNTFSLKRDKLG